MKQLIFPWVFKREPIVYLYPEDESETPQPWYCDSDGKRIVPPSEIYETKLSLQTDTKPSIVIRKIYNGNMTEDQKECLKTNNGNKEPK